jgi:uncharacterized protein YjgD (DUF1641 family)
MAQPIPLELPPRDPRAELQVRLQRAPIEHAEALLSGYDLLQLLHDRGVLNLLRGALGSGDRLTEIGVDALKKPEAVRTIRNLLILVETLGAIEPEALHCVAGAFPQALAAGSVQKPVPPSLFSLFRHFADTDVRRGIAWVNGFLGALGRNLPGGKGC